MAVSWSVLDVGLPLGIETITVKSVVAPMHKTGALTRSTGADCQELLQIWNMLVLATNFV